MSKAVEETLRKLERAHINEPSPPPSASSPSSAASTATAMAPSPGQGHDTLGYALKDDAAAAAADQSSDQQGAASAESAAKARNRRAVQSMYGAPPGYNATMGLGGARDSLAHGRVASGRQRNSIMVPAVLVVALAEQMLHMAA
ncbi:hypothetical protein GGI04_004928 [Coemansia thaxteri]|nr:hypothetical protein GGI04_004928 [Coemansia thaxteri]